MNTPYSTPTSELNGDNRYELRPKKLWKIFFWFIVVAEILSIKMMIGDNDPIVKIFADVFVYSFVIMGLFGYSYNRRIINRMIWKLTIPVALFYDVYTMLVMDVDGAESAGELMFTSVFLVVTVTPLLFFQYLGLFKYAYRSDEIWQYMTGHSG